MEMSNERDNIYDHWIHENAQIVRWLWNSMETSISANVLFFVLKRRFEMYLSDKNIFRMY